MTVKQFSDAARRISDEMNMHAIAKSGGSWAVFALADGRPLDHTAYPTWTLAVTAAKWDRDRYMFIEVQPDGCNPNEAEALLTYQRTLYSMGYRIPSPDWAAGPMASSMPTQSWDKRTMANQLISGRPIDPRGFSNLPNEQIIPPAFLKKIGK
jgi:hypothetical protein